MRKISLVLIIFLIINISIILIYPKKENEILNSIKDSKNNMLSIMMERDAGKGNYIDAASFPNTGYYLNKNLSKCVNGSKLSFSEGNLIIKGNKTDRCYAYFDKDELGSICRGQNMAECFTKNYKKDSSIIYHDGASDYDGMENYELEAEDLSYRYTGSNDVVHNYVCFGSDDEKCPDDNLYRIIGLFKNEEGKYETKLIKADYANKDLLGSGNTNPSEMIDYNKNGTLVNSIYNKMTGNDEEKDAYIHRYRGSLKEVNRYKYQENSTTEIEANWPNSLLNTIHLNYNYLNTFDKQWQDKIIDYKWHYKGSTWGNIAVGNKTSSNNIRTTFDYEIGLNSDKTLTEPTKIGLMYVSDFLYSASSNNWNKKPYNGTYGYVLENLDSEGNPQGTYNGTDGTDYRSAIDENWMYLGLWEYTITQRTDESGFRAFIVHAPSIIGSSSVVMYAFAIRPCFYLATDVKLKEGNGTKEIPYRITFE